MSPSTTATAIKKLYSRFGGSESTGEKDTSEVALAHQADPGPREAVHCSLGGGGSASDLQSDKLNISPLQIVAATDVS
jgi:hypothetical protein